MLKDENVDYQMKAVQLACHMSASTRKDVAEAFRGDQGLLLTIPPQTIAGTDWYKGCGGRASKLGAMAPVAWISKFGDNEAEVLFCRLSWYSWHIIEESRAAGRQEATARYLVYHQLAPVLEPREAAISTGSGEATASASA